MADFLEQYDKAAPISESSISEYTLYQIAKSLGKTQFRSYKAYHYGYNVNARSALEIQEDTKKCDVIPTKTYEEAVQFYKNSEDYLAKNQGKSCLIDYVKNALFHFRICSPYFITFIEKISVFRELREDETDLHVFLGMYFDDKNVILVENDRCEYCNEFEYGKTVFTESMDFDINNLLLTVPCSKLECNKKRLDKLIEASGKVLNEAQSQHDKLTTQRSKLSALPQVLANEKIQSRAKADNGH